MTWMRHVCLVVLSVVLAILGPVAGQIRCCPQKKTFNPTCHPSCRRRRRTLKAEEQCCHLDEWHTGAQCLPCEEEDVEEEEVWLVRGRRDKPLPPEPRLYYNIWLSDRLATNLSLVALFEEHSAKRSYEGADRALFWYGNEDVKEGPGLLTLPQCAQFFLSKSNDSFANCSRFILWSSSGIELHEFTGLVNCACLRRRDWLNLKPRVGYCPKDSHSWYAFYNAHIPCRREDEDEEGSLKSDDFSSSDFGLYEMRDVAANAKEWLAGASVCQPTDRTVTTWHMMLLCALLLLLCGPWQLPMALAVCSQHPPLDHASAKACSYSTISIPKCRVVFFGLVAGMLWPCAAVWLAEVWPFWFPAYEPDFLSTLSALHYEAHGLINRTHFMDVDGHGFKSFSSACTMGKPEYTDLWHVGSSSDVRRHLACVPAPRGGTRYEVWLTSSLGSPFFLKGCGESMGQRRKKRCEGRAEHGENNCIWFEISSQGEGSGLMKMKCDFGAMCDVGVMTGVLSTPRYSHDCVIGMMAGDSCSAACTAEGGVGDPVTLMCTDDGRPALTGPMPMCEPGWIMGLQLLLSCSAAAISLVLVLPFAWRMRLEYTNAPTPSSGKRRALKVLLCKLLQLYVAITNVASDALLLTALSRHDARWWVSFILLICVALFGCWEMVPYRVTAPFYIYSWLGQPDTVSTSKLTRFNRGLHFIVDLVELVVEITLVTDGTLSMASQLWQTSIVSTSIDLTLHIFWVRYLRLEKLMAYGVTVSP